MTKKFREKETEVLSTQAEVLKLGRLLQEAEDRHRAEKLEKETELETMKIKQRRDKELVRINESFLSI